MTTIWPNGFAGSVDWRSWSDGLWQAASAGGLGPDASGEPQTTEPDAPVVVITNAPPSNVETYAPPSGMPSDFFDGMDLAAYFSLIGYDPAAIEEMNANGSYRSEHDAYQANGGLQSQAEEAWRRSGMWASGPGFNDPGRELFFNNYMDSAYGVDPESGASRNTANMSDYLSMLEGALNAASKAVFDNKGKPEEEQYKQKLIALRSSIEQLGFNVSRVTKGVAVDPDLTDETSVVGQNTRHIVSIAAGSNLYQPGGMDGFLNVGWFRSGSDNSSGPKTGIVFGGSSNDPEVRLQIAENLGKQFASAIGIKGAASPPGTNTEAGAAVIEENGKVMLYWISIGSQDTVPATGFAKELLQADPNRKLLWVIHNHPSGSEFSTNDIENGRELAYSSNSQLNRFQGLLLGLPDGRVSTYPAGKLREN